LGEFVLDTVRLFGINRVGGFRGVISAAINYNIASPFIVHVGLIPAGNRIILAGVNNKTVFNAGTTNVLTMGTVAGSYADVMGSGDINEASATWQEKQLDTVLLVDTDYYVKYVQTGGAATTGSARVFIDYMRQDGGN
jgi:hypothetical protein